MCSGNNHSRREFITKPLAYLASAGLLSASGRWPGVEEVLAADAPASGKVIRRRLGRTGVELPVVSMGVMNADIPGLLVRAYELGVRHFDTAAKYQAGRNEEMVGNFVKERGVRDKVVIATKVFLPPPVRRDPAQAKAQFLKEFDGCLRRLQMDYVDILYYHVIETAADVNAPSVQEAMTDLKKQGKVRFLGVSTHSGQTEVLNAVAQGGFHDVVLMAINFTMSENQPLLEAIKNAAAKGVGLIAMKTQAGGQWYQQEMLHRQFTEPIQHAAALKWVLQNEAITTAIPGFTKYEQIDQDFPVASNLGYTPEERQFLADKSVKARLEFCQQCGECVPTCPKQVDIPTLMRTHMYARQYGNSYQARFTLAQVPEDRGLDVCRACPVCTASCAQTVNIARKIGELKTVQFA
jgi:predicted aldo/keto reductase-like oxidoreductase